MKGSVQMRTDGGHHGGLNTKGPTIVFFLGPPRPLPSYG